MTEEGYLYIRPGQDPLHARLAVQQGREPDGDHRARRDGSRGQRQASTIINHANYTCSQQHTEYSVTGGANAPWYQALDLWSSRPRYSRRCSGQATQKGTTTVHGTLAIALSITVPRARNLHRTLYVDALTCQPLRTVTVADGNPWPYVADWMPATPDNIAKAKDGDSIPVSYTKVDKAG
jgi:hypothetical protein